MRMKKQTIETCPFIGFAIFKNVENLSPEQAVIAYFPVNCEDEAKQYAADIGGSMGYVGGTINVELAVYR